MTHRSATPAPDATPGDRGRPRDWTGTPYGHNRRIRRAPGGGCVLCAQRATVWDHCHRHGIIRGPLCARCNRIVADLDAGTGAGYAPPWRGARACPGLLITHLWPAAELVWESTHGPRATLDYRQRCPECVTSGVPAELAELAELAAKANNRDFTSICPQQTSIRKR